MTEIIYRLSDHGTCITPCPYGHNSAPEVGADVDYVGSAFCQACESHMSHTDRVVVCESTNERINYCGECAMMLEEDHAGRGYCAAQDLYTFVECGDKACDEFMPKNE